LRDTSTDFKKLGLVFAAAELLKTQSALLEQELTFLHMFLNSIKSLSAEVCDLPKSSFKTLLENLSVTVG